MKKTGIIIGVVLIVVLIAFRLFSNKKTIDSTKQLKATTEEAVSVTVEKVEKKANEQTLHLIGTVKANQEIEVKSEVQGKILSLNVALGDYVPKGKVIAKIDDKIRQITVANAERSLADAKQNVARYKNLYEGGAATKAQFDQYQLSYENANNQIEQAKKELSNAVIVSPINGYVTQKAVESGAFANIGTSIVTIVDISKLKIQLNVPENNVYSLKVGDPVIITANVYPGIVFKGQITFISSNGDDSHNYPVEIGIENQAKNPLKAGTYVDIDFNKKNKVTSLQIPREALVGSVKNGQVYVVEQNRAKLKGVTVGADNGDYLEILKGLEQGDQIVTTGQINLTDSALVKITPQH